MLHLKKISSDLFSQLNIEQIQNAFIIGIVLFILIVSSIALNRPINSAHFEQVQALAAQNRLERTHEMATLLLAKPKIKNIEFYRLLNAYHIENARIKIYPAIEKLD